MLITLKNNINDLSFQVGDKVYYNTINEEYYDSVNNQYYTSYNNPNLIGEVLNINNSSIDVMPLDLINIPNIPVDSFIFYAKDARVGVIVGTGVAFISSKHSSADISEILSADSVKTFSFSSEVTQSSK